jgi:RNA polymerase sigma-70 factor (ECF subfamily)
MLAVRHAIDTAMRFCEGAGAPVRVQAMPSDIELMQRAAEGDPEAFAEIYDRHAGVLLALAQRLLPRTVDALDLLHDVFLEAWQHVREYDPGRSAPRTWLIVRLRSRALDRRARAARGSSVANQLETVPGLNPMSGEGSALQGDLLIEVTRALEVLDGDVRRVLELTYFDGLTALEISARDGTAVGTVRSRLARGLTQLRGLLTTREDSRHD